MTPALKAMVEAMVAEAERQTDAVFRDDDGKTLCLSVEGGSLDLEKVARAGLSALNGEALARAMALIDLRQTAARAGPGCGEDVSHAAWIMTQPTELARWLDRLWPQYVGRVEELLHEILRETP